MTTPHTITIIGGRGRMGAMLCRAWSERHTVFALDRREGAAVLCTDELCRYVPQSDIVLLSVPAPVVSQVLQRIQPYLNEKQILTDVCSVKLNPMYEMEKNFSGPVVGTHPLFGPGNNREEARVAIIPGVKATATHIATITKLFRELGSTAFIATAEEHDRAVAFTQSLHFCLSAAYFALAGEKSEIEKYITPSFKRYMNAARKELTINTDMFCEFTQENPLFSESIEEIRKKLTACASGSLESISHKAAQWFETTTRRD